jgi:hypothetical protein
MAGTIVEGRATHEHYVAKQIDATAWSLFFMWVGFAMLADLSWGVGLIGVGVITVGAQLARRMFHLAVEGFWLVVGILFLAGGLWERLAVRAEFVPVILIAAGAALLLSALVNQYRGRAE